MSVTLNELAIASAPRPQRAACHSVVMSRAGDTVPPELDQYVASKKLRTLQPRQRDAVLAMLRSGVFSAEEAGTTLNTVADNTFS